MKNFPCEYLFVTNDGDCFFKAYATKKKETTINAHTLASLPVIFDKGATVNTIFKLVEKNPQIKPILYYADEFLKEAEKEPTANDVYGKIRFTWEAIEMQKNYFHVSYPKLEVDGVDENGEAFGIEFLGVNNIKNLELIFKNDLHIIDADGKEMIVHSHPTLFQVIYGLFWEISFFGNPEARDIESNKIKEALEDVKAGKYTTTDDLFNELKSK